MTAWRDTRTANREDWRHAAILGVVYFVAAALAASLTRYGGGVCYVWIATAILTADFVFQPARSWLPRCLTCGLASAIAVAWVGLGVVSALPLALINIGEAVGSALLLLRLTSHASRLASPREIAILILFPGILVPLASAFPAAAVAHLARGVPYWGNFNGWATAHALGAMTILPLAYLWLGGDMLGWVRKVQRRDRGEAIVIGIVMAAVTVLVFALDDRQMLFLPLPMMVAVFRIGRLGATGAIAILTVVAMTATALRVGPIARMPGDTAAHVQFLQFYIAIAMLMTLPAAAELKRRKTLLSRAEESAALLTLIADRSDDIILALEIDGSVRYASASLTAMLGRTADDVRQQHFAALVHPEDAATVAAAHRDTLSSPERSCSVEFRMLKPGGGIGWFEAQGRAAIDDTGTVTGLVSIIREVSQRKVRELDLAKAASTDPLTGLLNRRAFESAIDAGVDLATLEGCVAVFDLDYFKHINDRHGHATGDEVLKTFARILSAAVRETDIVARMGGEEFVGFFPGLTPGQAGANCERIRADLAAMVFLSRTDASLRATVSVGIAQVSNRANLAAAIREADRALYRAKSEGRNRVALAA